MRIAHKIDLHGVTDIDAAGLKDNESARAALTKQGIRFEAPGVDEQQFWREIGAATMRKMLAEKQISADLLAAIQKQQAAWQAQAGKSTP